jgi:hypothetical protein
MSAADGLAWNEEDAGAIPATLTILEGRQTGWPCASTWLHLSRKQDRHDAEVETLPTPSANHSTLNERKSHEARSPLPKPTVVPQERQTKSCPPNPPGEVEIQLSSCALRFETTNQNL